MCKRDAVRHIENNEWSVFGEQQGKNRTENEISLRKIFEWDAKQKWKRRRIEDGKKWIDDVKNSSENAHRANGKCWSSIKMQKNIAFIWSNTRTFSWKDPKWKWKKLLLLCVPSWMCEWVTVAAFSFEKNWGFEWLSERIWLMCSLK